MFSLRGTCVRQRRRATGRIGANMCACDCGVREKRGLEPIWPARAASGIASGMAVARRDASLQAGARPRGANLRGDMAVTLARRQAGESPRGGARRRKPLMEKFVIEGGAPLSGTMVPAGNKNGALPILAATILTEDEVVVRNVPRIRDVEAMLEILAAMGVHTSWR